MVQQMNRHQALEERLLEPKAGDVLAFGSDKRAVLKSASEVIGDNAAAVRSAIIVDPPDAADSEGTSGQIAFDEDYIYVCVAEDTWMRAAIEAWS